MTAQQPPQDGEIQPAPPADDDRLMAPWLRYVLLFLIIGVAVLAVLSLLTGG